MRIFVNYRLAETIIFDGRRVEYGGSISFLVCAPGATEVRGVGADRILLKEGIASIVICIIYGGISLFDMTFNSHRCTLF